MLLIGCNDPAQHHDEKPQVKPQAESRGNAPFRRFEPAFSTDGYGIALDTVTGQWCKAWNWKMHPTNATLTGLNDLPLCTDIYENRSKNDPLGILGTQENPIVVTPEDMKKEGVR